MWIGLLIGGLGVVVYQWRNAQRPRGIPLPVTPLWTGVTYERMRLTDPRLNIIHIVTVDYLASGIQFQVTPPDYSGGMDLLAQKTTDFVEKQHAQVGINGGYFYPFHAALPFYFYPKQYDPVYVVGTAISDGVLYSEDKDGWPVLCFLPEQLMINITTCPSNTEQAIAGNSIILQDGALYTQNFWVEDHPYAHARVVVAYNNETHHVWMIVIDGRQRNYSVGMSIPEIAEFLLSLGATDAINLDGGGSTTLAMQDGDDVRLYNAPFHTHIPMLERSVANHLILFADPLSTDSSSFP